MTLKEKFNNLDYFDSVDRFNSLSHDSDECEKIADDYAIKFAEWTWNKDLISINDCDFFEYKFNLHTRKELLEIFKKEKGL